MTNPNEAWMRVPVSLLARLSDSLVKIRCIDGDLITGSIQQETQNGIKAIQLHLDNHNAKQQQALSEVTHA